MQYCFDNGSTNHYEWVHCTALKRGQNQTQCYKQQLWVSSALNSDYGWKTRWLDIGSRTSWITIECLSPSKCIRLSFSEYHLLFSVCLLFHMFRWTRRFKFVGNSLQQWKGEVVSVQDWTACYEDVQDSRRTGSKNILNCSTRCSGWSA